MTYRILAFDGGGVRGLLTTILLKRLEDVIPGWIEKSDLFAGTSVGSLLAIGLSKGYQSDQLVGVFQAYGPKLFEPANKHLPLWIYRYFHAGFQTRLIDRLLKQYFGNARLGDLSKKVIVPAFRLDNKAENPNRRNWETVTFHNFSDRPDHTCQRLIRQVIRYATATPTIFPSIDGFVDGGLVANNPSLLALTHVLDSRYAGNCHPKRPEITVFSLGTGFKPRYIVGQQHDWGYLQWQKYLIDLMANGCSLLVDRQCQQLLAGRYHRLSPPLTEKVEAHEHAKLDLLVEMAESVDLRQTIEWLKQNWLEPVISHQPLSVH